MSEKVSIIIPCYNQGKFVSDALNSALKQTYKEIEIVIINDGSTDNSSEVIKSFADIYKNIVFLDEKENKGVISVRNKAINMCSGEYILPLDADDTIEPTYVEKAAKILKNNPNIGIVYCKAKMFGSINGYWNLDDFDKSNILYSNCIFATALFRKTDFLKAGMYKDYMRYGCEDYDLWLSFIENGFDVYRIDEVLFNYRQYEEDSRTKICSKNQDKVWLAIIKNHINLYLEDKQFLTRLLYTDTSILKKKCRRYKKLFNLFLPIVIMQSVLLIILLFYLFITWRNK
ncbi:glycosyltransferase family 2 protein [bacterium]|nr:glycosyltransferase family 2 protein [bacterium]